MKRWLILAVAAMTFAVGSAPAMAFDTKDADILNGMATVIASEKPCGLKYDQEAIKRFIVEHVKAELVATEFAAQAALNKQSLSVPDRRMVV